MSDPATASSPRAPISSVGQVRSLAAVATAGFVAFLALVLVMHVLQPELDPVTRFASEYAPGTAGWLMNVAFVALATALAALAVAFGWTLRPSLRSRAAGILLAISSVGFLASGVFNSDLQTDTIATGQGMAHDLAGFIAFLTLFPAMVAIGGRLRKNKRPRGLFLTVLAWVVIALFLAMLFLFEPSGMVGLGQRIFLAAMLGWLLITARGLGSGAFDVADEVTSGAP